VAARSVHAAPVVNGPPPTSVPVAIVGAGPTGLTLALDLARHGVRSLLLERGVDTSRFSRAAGLHVRTREVFARLGVERALRDAGTLVRVLRPVDAATGRPLLAIDFGRLREEAADPGLVVVEQSVTERVLLDAVRAAGLCDVRFGAEAIALSPSGDAPHLTVRQDGATWTVEARFVVGCDGAGSFIRGELGLPFEGATYGVAALLADVGVRDERDGLPWPRIRNQRGGITAAIRLRPRLWRIIRVERSDPDDPGEEVQRQVIDQRVAESLAPGPVDVLWSSRFRIHRRSSRRFRVGPVLLAGDAAHVHSPVGGQGMNAGIQDAHNLGWKLAAALGGGDTDRLLDSYETERRAVVVGDVTRYTHLVTRVFLQTPGVVRAAGFALLRLALAVPRLHRANLRRMAMIDLDYPASALLDSGDAAAGVRLPNVVLHPPAGPPVRLHDLLPPGAALLAVGGAAESPMPPDLPVAAALRIGPGHHLEPGGRLRRLLGSDGGWILVRPDGHVAWARAEPHGLRAAARRALGLTG
jgi:2-polyprenyl-6-methoxyphenol hydroxylase-like FAD-dependent oxidoreductase